MELPRFTDNLNMIGSLPDRPAMTAEELKRNFDYAGKKIKTYINDVLLPGLETNITEENQTFRESIETLIENYISEINQTLEDLELNVNTTLSDFTTEINNSMSNLSTSLNQKINYNDFYISTNEYSYNLSAGETTSPTVNIRKNEYFPIGIVGYYSSNEACNIKGIYITSKEDNLVNIAYRVYNSDWGNRRTGSIRIDVLWIRIK